MESASPGILASYAAAIRMKSWNWVERSVVQGIPDSATISSAASLEAK
jgi:hypothetical protein